MAEILRGGSAAVQALLYGDVHPGTRRFFESRRNTSFDDLRDTARNLATSAIERFGFMAADRTKRLIRDVRRSVDWAFHGDYIRPLRTLEAIQMASPLMRRYVMAEPTLRGMFHRQQLSGYDEGYVDLQPRVIGEDHLDYQRVMQDVVVVGEIDEDGFQSVEATHYMGAYADDEEPMDLDEQDDVLMTWAIAKALIGENKQDPTSLYGATLE